MKILLINTLYNPNVVGGAEISVSLLAEDLVKKGYDVYVYTLTSGNMRKSNINGVNVVYFPIRNIYWPFFNKKRNFFSKIIWHFINYFNVFSYIDVKKEILKINPDIIHTNNLSGFSPLIWRLKRHVPNAKLIHTSRDYYLFHPNCSLYKNGKSIKPQNIFVLIYSFLYKKMSKNVDCYVGISSYIKALHVENGFFKGVNSKYIYNTVDCKSKKNKKAELDTINVGFIGQLSYEKGFDKFCDISKKFSTEKIRFLAAGRFSKNAEKLQLLAKNSNVQTLGFIDINKFIEKVDVVYLPVCWNEPFGRTIVECALSGIFVFTNLLGGIYELSTLFENIRPIDEFFDYIENTELETINMDVNYKIFSRDYISNQYIEIYENL